MRYIASPLSSPLLRRRGVARIRQRCVVRITVHYIVGFLLRRIDSFPSIVSVLGGKFFISRIFTLGIFVQGLRRLFKRTRVPFELKLKSKFIWEFDFSSIFFIFSWREYRFEIHISRISWNSSCFWDACLKGLVFLLNWSWIWNRSLFIDFSEFFYPFMIKIIWMFEVIFLPFDRIELFLEYIWFRNPYFEDFLKFSLLRRMFKRTRVSFELELNRNLFIVWFLFDFFYSFMTNDISSFRSNWIILGIYLVSKFIFLGFLEIILAFEMFKKIRVPFELELNSKSKFIYG